MASCMNLISPKAIPYRFRETNPFMHLLRLCEFVAHTSAILEYSKDTNAKITERRYRNSS